MKFGFSPVKREEVQNDDVDGQSSTTQLAPTCCFGGVAARVL
jgi:hypothetical protein